MKPTLLVLFAATFTLIVPARDELRTVYEADTVIRYEGRDWTQLAPGESGLTINGEELPADEGFDLSPPAQEWEERLSTATYIDEVEDGRPVLARREFDEIGKSESDPEGERELEGVLQGRTIVLRAEEDGEVEAELEDDEDEVDESFLRRHQIIYSVDHLLPDAEMEEGDSWSLDDDAARAFLGFGDYAEPRFFAEEDEEEDPFQKAVEESAEVSVEVTYLETVERDGVRCALLEAEIEVEVDEAELDPDDLGEPIFEGMENEAHLSLRMEGSELIWLALEAGHPLAHEGEMEGELAVVMVMSADGMEMVMTITTEVSGGYEGTWTVE